MKKVKFKTIRSQGKAFIRRLSFYKKDGTTIKAHLITDDDNDKEEHSHPWDFKSTLLIPYKEIVNGEEVRHYMLETVERKHFETHKVKLYRVFGIRIPAITIGVYGKKKVLCNFCKSLGYCRTTGEPI